jgi:hypothetical protein
MVVVELDAGSGAGEDLIASELKLLNEVLMGQLGKTATLIGIKVDVINPKGSGNILGTSGIKGATEGKEVLALLKVNVDLDLVVLESNEGKSKADVAAEPELEGNIDSFLGNSGNTNHLVVAILLANWKRELIPDVHPSRVVLVNALASDLELNVLEESKTDLGNPGLTGSKSWHLGNKVDTVDKIAVAADLASHTATETGVTVKDVLNSLHGEVCVPAVNNLEDKCVFL